MKGLEISYVATVTKKFKIPLSAIMTEGMSEDDLKKAIEKYCQNKFSSLAEQFDTVTDMDIDVSICNGKSK